MKLDYLSGHVPVELLCWTLFCCWRRVPEKYSKLFLPLKLIQAVDVEGTIFFETHLYRQYKLNVKLIGLCNKL